MRWQQKAIQKITLGQDERSLDPENDTAAGDSSILRYIKTLTNHQMNAKQQRMDQYLQQVKHVQPVENVSVRPSKSFQYPVATRNQYQERLSTGSRTKVKSRRNDRVRNDHQRVAAATKQPCSRSKRPYDKNHEDRQLKMPNKQAKQTTIIESLEKFRLHGAWSQKSAESHCDDGSKMLQDATVSTGKMSGQSVAMQSSTRMPQTSSSQFSTMRTDLERRSIQELRPLSVLAHADSIPPHHPCSNFARPISFLSPEETPPRNLDGVAPQLEMFIPTYDPLATVMESIYF